MTDTFWGLRTYCLITGASQGIGRSFAVAFADKLGPGSRLTLLARSDANLRQTEALITATSPHVNVQIHSVDLSRPDASVFSKILRSEAMENYELKLLVHNAGSIGRANQLAAEMDDPEEWNRYLSLNLFHVTSLTAEFLRVFTSGRRTIVNITSLCAIKPFKSMGYYCVGKASREMYFKVLADENPELDIINYSPGPVDTDMVSEVISKVKNEETKAQFVSMKKTSGLVTLEQTTSKIIALLASRKHIKGERFDYYDMLI